MVLYIHHHLNHLVQLLLIQLLHRHLVLGRFLWMSLHHFDQNHLLVHLRHHHQRLHQRVMLYNTLFQLYHRLHLLRHHRYYRPNRRHQLQLRPIHQMFFHHQLKMYRVSSTLHSYVHQS
jgi:hypothetical protein